MSKKAQALTSFSNLSILPIYSLQASTHEISPLFNFSANSRITHNGKSIENLLGKRIPNSNNSQKNFKLLIVVLTNKTLTDEQWDKVDATAEWFSKKEDDGTHLYNFWEATNGIGSINIEN